MCAAFSDFAAAPEHAAAGDVPPGEAAAAAVVNPIDQGAGAADRPGPAAAAEGEVLRVHVADNARGAGAGRRAQKRLRRMGQAYTGRSNEERGARIMGAHCDCALSSNAKTLKCRAFNEGDRQRIFTAFWSTMTWEQRHVFICSNVDQAAPKRPAGGAGAQPRRAKTMVYHLQLNGERTRVCKTLFTNTLAVNGELVAQWLKSGGSETGMAASADARLEAREQPPMRSRVSAARRNQVVRFFDGLPKMPSHYCRSSTKKLYFEPIWTSTKQLFDEYVAWMSGQDGEAVSESVFGSVYRRSNTSLFRPKKDQCDTCVAYEEGNITAEVHNRHRAQAQRAQEEKAKDKAENKDVMFSMDLESVLLCPRILASAVYYKTKLIVHNQTFYTYENKHVSCFVWDETNGGLVASIFSTILVDFITETIDHDKDKFIARGVIFFSDGCGYQNRNTVLANALSRLAAQTGVHITQKFLFRGHTQMEVDTAHSVIERRLKGKKIYVPSQYIEVMEGAGYTTKNLEYNIFRDYTKVKGGVKSIRPGRVAGDPTVNDLRALRYQPDGRILYKTNFDEDWAVLPARSAPFNMDDEVPRLYQEPQKIESTKFAHMAALKSVVPADYHPYYDSLPHH